MNKAMKDNQKLAEAMHLQTVESNPLDADQVAMFEMFEREGWSPERRLAHIRERAAEAATVSAAE